MNKIEKKLIAVQLIERLGPKGIISITPTKILCAFKNGSPTDQDLVTEEPIFRFAACDDLFPLMALHPDLCRFERDSDPSPALGLKSLGTIFCAEKISRIKPQRILEKMCRLEL